MTVSTEISRVIVQGNAVTTSFAYTFPIPGSSATDQTNAELVLTDASGVSTTLANNLWSITGVVTDISDGVGGNFVYKPGSPITTGSSLTLARIVPYTQDTTLGSQSAYSPTVVENALDDLALQTEQLNTWRLQSVRAPLTDAALSDLPTVVKRKGSFLYFDNTTGDVTTVSSTSGISGSVLVGSTVTNSTLTTDLLLTGSAVGSVITVSGVTTATLNAGAAPALTNTHIFVGNGSNVATDVALSGDATMANTGAITLATVNGNVGSFTNAAITVNAKGLITAAANGTTAALLASANAFTKSQTGPTGALTDAATVAWAADTVQIATLTIAGNRTLGAPSNAVIGTYILIITQGSGGSHTLAYNAVFKWPGSTAPTLSTAAGAVDILTFVSNGTTFYGVAQLAFA